MSSRGASTPSNPGRFRYSDPIQFNSVRRVYATRTAQAHPQSRRILVLFPSGEMPAEMTRAACPPLVLEYKPAPDPPSLRTNALAARQRGDPVQPRREPL